MAMTGTTTPPPAARSMPITVFFSWQADTPTIAGRNLIERALARAVLRIGQDTTVEEAVRELVIDRDTMGVAGSPPIVETIFRKIDGAAVFLPDLTFIGKRLDNRPTPNPNVLIEYGWALKSLGHGRIVPVMNTTYGKPAPEVMPFNILHLRNPTLYECPPDADEGTRQRVREALSKELERRIRDVFASDDFRNSLPKAPKPKAFPGQEPRNGLGRFRRPGEPLGVTETFRAPPHEVKLIDGPVVWFRVMPTVDPGRMWSVMELKKAATENGYLSPIGPWPTLNSMRGADGFGIYAPFDESRDTTRSAVFTFTSGEVWSVDSSIMGMGVYNGRKTVPPIERELGQALEAYCRFLVKLGIKPPFRWIAGMQDLRGRGIFVPVPPGWIATFPGPQGSCLSDVVSDEGLHSPGEPPAKSLKPFFDKFDSCGVERPEWLDA